VAEQNLRSLFRFYVKIQYYCLKALAESILDHVTSCLHIYQSMRNVVMHTRLVSLSLFHLRKYSGCYFHTAVTEKAEI
jgi:hypothetical protein